MKNIGCNVIVKGHVQGVGFRYYTSLEASKKGLTGQVKNLENGDVEVILYGTEKKVKHMLQWLDKGPKTARVETLNVREIPYLNISGFAHS